ncbi:hypothetical protein [Pseudanabaena sp. FACHB-2040]|uniref:hypothetical protein n=1 Tax=Pseudanabaena sp. FACHB-2040 TaxID=2692859 RepID=UPI0016899CC5|nr:hypothetical protein [Pseudanabaena sp. FACHB-2040]MBD2259654.1 hypothetical protein [Pseudanabaena sp. FACHB-2040]
MRFFSYIFGLALILLGIYFLGKNIVFTTHAYPWWRGIAADVSVLSLCIGVFALVFLPSAVKSLGWVAVAFGIICVFASSRAILSPTSLWQFFLSLTMMGIGYKMLTRRRRLF